MKTTRTARALLTAASLAGILATSIELWAAPPGDAKKVQIACKPGWRAGAGGTYGGVPFSISCENGRSTQILPGTTGTAYSFRMGVENESAAYDCAFSGDAANVHETCVQVRLTIR